MNSCFLGMIPVLTTQAGMCLTTANWQEVGVTAAAFHLESLLMKPGNDFLRTLDKLATYVAWNEQLVLNASLPPINSAGFYALRSQYDGRRSEYSIEEIEALIVTLQPTMVVLPSGGVQKNKAFWQSLPDSIFPFFSVTDLPESFVIEKKCGVYLSYDKQSPPSELLQQVARYQEQACCYVAGDLSLPLMQQLVKNGATFVESDRPASDACFGKVYCTDGELLLQDSVFSMQHQTIDSSCCCPTCSQQFTRAYLHHLLGHTPLLCQRLLVQHNVHYCQTMLNS